MKKKYKIDIDKSYSIDTKITKFLNPEYVCIVTNEIDKLPNTKNVIKNKPVINTDFETVSSVSGTIAGTVNVIYNDVQSNALFIKNDFKEKDYKEKNKPIKSVDEFYHAINKSRYKDLFNKKNVSNIIINGMYDNPYVITENYIVEHESDLVIEALSFLQDILEFDKTNLVFKNNQNDNISHYLSKTGFVSNMNVVVLNDFYDLNKEDFILKKLGLNKDDTIILLPSVLLDIIYFVKYNTYKNEKLLNVVNMKDKTIKLIHIKKNILVSELVNKLKIDNDMLFIKNSLLTGNSIDINKEIISDGFHALFIKENELVEEQSCINCGLCNEVCPNNVNVLKVKHTKIVDNKCNDCGLCSYYCPSKINLRKCLNGENK